MWTQSSYRTFINNRVDRLHSILCETSVLEKRLNQHGFTLFSATISPNSQPWCIFGVISELIWEMNVIVEDWMAGEPNHSNSATIWSINNIRNRTRKCISKTILTNCAMVDAIDGRLSLLNRFRIVAGVNECDSNFIVSRVSRSRRLGTFRLLNAHSTNIAVNYYQFTVIGDRSCVRCLRYARRCVCITVCVMVFFFVFTPNGHVTIDTLLT